MNKKMTRWGMGIVAAAASLGMFVATASAQLAPAPKAPAPAAKAPVKKAASACAKIDEAACKVNTECSWIVPTAVNKATGKVQAAHCKKSPAPKAKKAEAAPKGPAAPPVAKKP